MDTHQKISIGIFGALLLGTMAMYSTGNLSSSALNTTVTDTGNPCPEAFLENYAKIYESDKTKIAELKDFLRKDCRGEVVEAKKSYCDARTKQVVTYSNQVKKYEQCMSGEVGVND